MSASDGQRFRLLNVFDNSNRGALGIKIDFSPPVERVIRTLYQIIK
jgi:putative transposase